MESWHLVVGGLVLIVLLSLYSLIVGWRKGRLRYTLKVTWNNLRFTIQLILCMYFVLIAAYGMVYLAEMIEDADNVLITEGIPIAYLILMLIIACHMFGNKIIPKVSYDDQEREWRIEEIRKGRERLPKWLQRLYKEEKI